MTFKTKRHRDHFNYTLRVWGRKDEVVCDATKGRCQVTELPANSRIEASLVVCCEHKLCSLQSDQVGFTKPLEPKILVLTNITNRSISAYWMPPEPNSEPISKYAITIMGALERARSQTFHRFCNQFTFTRLRPTTFYTVRVVACARDNDCGPFAEAVAWTPPEGRFILPFIIKASGFGTFMYFDYSSNDPLLFMKKVEWV
ncbi:hypothetical protein TSMEX_008309 [Taenia solium]|eukprot:TsM_001007500 transcript=TsM_001007500 gene=TsM_001007500